MENLELNDFPLDCQVATRHQSHLRTHLLLHVPLPNRLVLLQDLTITITSERPDTEVTLIPDEDEMSGINVQTFVDQQVGKLHG